MLFIVDTSLGSVENIKLVAHKYELVLIIDHHTTFSTIIQHLSTDPINNCYYIFQETQCAAKLVYNLL